MKTYLTGIIQGRTRVSIVQHWDYVNFYYTKDREVLFFKPSINKSSVKIVGDK